VLPGNRRAGGRRQDKPGLTVEDLIEVRVPPGATGAARVAFGDQLPEPL
jgi:hypothetical protein